jgi:DNA-binding HxlR family transcriptional regulator
LHSLEASIYYIPNNKKQLILTYLKETMSWESCPVLGLMNTLSKRWVLHTIKTISEWKESFNEIKRSIPWISAKILSERLSELESEGFIVREVIEGKPIKIRYKFSERWNSLNQRIELLNQWAREDKIK